MREIVREITLLCAATLVAACGGTGSGGGAAERPPFLAREATAWRWDAPVPASVGMPASDEGGTVATYGHARLVHLEVDGELRWEVVLDRARDVAPLLLADTVVAATEVGLVAADRISGSVRWSAAMPDRANTAVAVGHLVVATTWQGDVMAFDSAGGEPVWSAALPGDSLGPPAASAGAVVATWDDGGGAGMAAFDAGSGAERWRVALAGGGVSAPAAAGGLAVAVTGDRTVVAVDLRSGEQRWSAPGAGGAGSPEVPPLSVGDEQWLVADRLGDLTLLDAAGSARWHAAGVGAAVRGGPAGPDADGRYALPVDDGHLLLAGPGVEPVVLDPAGRVPGVALGGDGRIVVATREAEVNSLSALSP